MTSHRPALACTAALLLLPAARAAAQTHVSGSAGVTTAYGQTYFSVGAHVGRELGRGVEPNLEATWWIGESPTVLKLAPGVNWYVPLERALRPFLGAYYARWLVGSGFEDQNAVGARVGVLTAGAGRTSFALGVSYERVLSCSTSCESWTPQASAGVAF
jgi:hypothetical protein